MPNPVSFEKLKTKHPLLSSVFEKYWDENLKTYAERLFDKPPITLESELKESLQEELLETGYNQELISKSIEQLEKKPVLQTAHHITPTNGPTFTTIDLICLSGLSENEVYLVGANSGVAFSNTAWSGALSFGNLTLKKLVKPETKLFYQAEKSARERINHGQSDQRISIILSRQRDQLVFGTQLTDFQNKIYQQFSTDLIKLIPEPQENTDYSQWAARTCNNLQKTLFRRNNLVIFDINQVIARYLRKILTSNSSHPVSRLFKDQEIFKEIPELSKEFGFLGSIKSKKSNKVDVLTWNGKGLTSTKKGFHQFSQDDLIEELEEKQLCPRLFIVFLILKYINGIRCLGSFNQITYLENYRQLLSKTKVASSLNLAPNSEKSLTTGRLSIAGENIWPIDRALKNQPLIINDFADIKMKEFWKPIASKLQLQ